MNKMISLTTFTCLIAMVEYIYANKKLGTSNTSKIAHVSAVNHSLWLQW